MGSRRHKIGSRRRCAADRAARTVVGVYLHPQFHRELARQRQIALTDEARTSRAGRTGRGAADIARWRRLVRFPRRREAWPEPVPEQGEMRWTCT